MDVPVKPYTEKDGIVGWSDLSILHIVYVKILRFLLKFDFCTYTKLNLNKFPITRLNYVEWE